MSLKSILLPLLALLIFFQSQCTGQVYADNYQIIINIPSRTIDLWNGNIIEKTYPVGVGRPSFPTPTGNFSVITKIKNPAWENPYKPAGEVRIRPGKSNPLGTRWIGFHRTKNDGEYGMHGTNNPFSVGKYSSHGCVRMYIKDSEALFDRVKIGTPVKVKYYTYKLMLKSNKLIVRKYPNAYKRKINPEGMINEQLSFYNKNYNIDETKLNKAYGMRDGASITIGELIPTYQQENQNNLLNFLKVLFHRFFPNTQP